MSVVCHCRGECSFAQPEPTYEPQPDPSGRTMPLDDGELDQVPLWVGNDIPRDHPRSIDCRPSDYLIGNQLDHSDALTAVSWDPKVGGGNRHDAYRVGQRDGNRGSVERQGRPMLRHEDP